MTMGVHKLRGAEIDIAGKEEVLRAVPDLDLYGLRQVVGIRLRRVNPFEPGSAEYNLEVEAEYEDAAGGVVVLGFSEVRVVSLPELRPSFFFGELEVEDISSHQLEGVHYRVRDFGMSKFEVVCKAVSIRWRFGLDLEQGGEVPQGRARSRPT
jgi:hypothetical protein